MRLLIRLRELLKALFQYLHSGSFRVRNVSYANFNVAAPILTLRIAQAFHHPCKDKLTVFGFVREAKETSNISSTTFRRDVIMIPPV